MAKTLLTLFLENVQRYPSYPLIWERDGEYRSISYKASFKIIAEIASGFMSLGLVNGDRVAIFAEECIEWFFSEMAVFLSGGVSVPLSIKRSALLEHRYPFNLSGARFVITSNQQLKRLLELKKDLPDLEKIILIDKSNHKDSDCIDLTEIRSLGRKKIHQKEGTQFEARWESITEDDIATIVFTSSSVSDVKDVAFTHRNLMTIINDIQDLYSIQQRYISLITLPWHHLFTRISGIFLMICHGGSFASIAPMKFPLNDSQFFEKVRDLQPQIIVSDSVQLNNLKNTIHHKLLTEKRVQINLYKKGIKAAFAYQGEGYWKNQWHGNLLSAPIHHLLNQSTNYFVKKYLGNQLQFVLCKGHILNKQCHRWYAAVGIPIYNSYGLIESASLISSNYPNKLKFGSSGTVLPTIDIKIRNDQGEDLHVDEIGEIVIQGKNSIQSNRHHSEEVLFNLQKEWFHTGDVGYLDKDDFLVVLGRKSNMLQLNGGESFCPEPVEAYFRGETSYIDQILLLNQNQSNITALIVPNKMAILDFMKQAKCDPKTLQGQEAVIQLFIDAIQKVHKESGFSEMWIPSTFTLLGKPFTIENGLLDVENKMIRKQILHRYQSRIQTMYSTKDETPINNQNRIIIQRLAES